MSKKPIKKLINKLFTTEVVKDGENYKVNFDGKGGEYGYILFRKAKKGWMSKPLSQGVYIVSDANLYQIMDTLSLYLSLEDAEINEFKREFVDASMNILDSYFLEQEGKDPHDDKDNGKEGEDDTTEGTDSISKPSSDFGHSRHDAFDETDEERAYDE